MPKDKDNNNSDLFKQAMQGVKPLGKSNKLSQPKPKKKFIKQAKLSSTQEPQAFVSDHDIELVDADTFLSYCQSGVQPRYFRKLKMGRFAVEAELDLHGMRLDEARSALLIFIENAYDSGLRVIRIVHGKGFRGREDKPLIKNKANTWLQQLPQILAFCSCIPKDGGTGAVYVLLKRAGATQSID